MAYVDPSDFTRPVGHTFLYSERGAAPIRRTDTDRPAFVLADKLTDPSTSEPVAYTDDDPWTYRCGNADAYTNPIDWDRNTGVPADEQSYAITPGKHAGTYNGTYDSLWVQLFGPSNRKSRHARSDRD